MQEFESPAIKELSIGEIDLVSGGMSDTTAGLLLLGAGIVVGVALGGGAVIVAAALLA